MSAGGPSGVLVIDKERGYTSMDVCAIVRGRLRRGGAPKRVKVGHGGTLDPAATGVLVVLVGSQTKRCDEVMAGEKEYEGVIDLSRVSTTDDLEGDVREAEGARDPGEERVRAILTRFVGRIDQRPPAFSALHVGGRRAYDIARAGGRVELAPRPVEVHALEVLSYAWPMLAVRVVCGKGTYIRSLARDVGAGLGVGGLLASLRRTRVGRFDLSMAHRLGELPEAMGQGDLSIAE